MEQAMTYGRPKSNRNLISGDLVGRRFRRPKRPSLRKFAKIAAVTAVNPAAGAAYAVHGDLVGRSFMKKIKKVAKKTVNTAAKVATSKPAMLAIGVAAGAGGTIAVQQAAKAGLATKAKNKISNLFVSDDDKQIAALQKQIAEMKNAQTLPTVQLAAPEAPAVSVQEFTPAVQSVPVLQTVAAVVPSVVPAETAARVAQVYSDIPAAAQATQQAAASTANAMNDILGKFKPYLPYIAAAGAGLVIWKIMK